MKHSKVVGSSTAARRYHCPGSIDLEAEIPEPPESSYAAEGTALHSGMEWLLDNDLMPADMKGMTFYGYEITSEYVDLLSYCLRAFEDVVGVNDFDLETTFEFPGIEGAFGTGDVIWYDWGSEALDRAGIMDWKFGGGVAVTTPGNMQAKFLLCGMRAKAEGITRDTKLFATFVQPRKDYAETVEFTHAELDAFEADLHHAVTHRRYAEDNLKTGSHCKFCKATVICPKKQALAQAAFQWGDLAKEDLPKALAMVEEVEAWAAEVRSAAHKALDAGAEIQGWKLVQKRGRRVWDPELTEKQIERRLYEKGLLKPQRFNSTLITPPQAEKLLGVGTVREMDLVRNVDGKGTTLARENDERPAVQGTARNLSTLFRAISSNQTED